MTDAIHYLRDSLFLITACMLSTKLTFALLIASGA